MPSSQRHLCLCVVLGGAFLHSFSVRDLLVGNARLSSISRSQLSHACIIVCLECSVTAAHVEQAFGKYFDISLADVTPSKLSSGHDASDVCYWLVRRL